MSDVLTYTVEDGIAQVILNRPDKYNALSIPLFEAIVEAGEAIKKDNSVRAVVLSGSGGNFCAGLDMENFTSGKLNEGLEPRTHGDTNLYQHVAWVWHEIEVPVIAAVQGVCLGGFASGGPIGALAGAGLGWILGDKTQEALGVGGKAYRVTTESGEEIVVRSPNKHWENGDQVRIVGNRLVAESSVLEVSSR